MSSPFFLAQLVLFYMAVVVCWLRGGHPERFGLAVLIVDHLATTAFPQYGRVGDAYLSDLARDVVVALAFGWLALRADRWWPIAVTAGVALSAVVHLMGMVIPDLSRYAVLSALLGVWMVVYTIMLASVAERWLAGERAVSGAAVWRRRRGAS